MAEFMQSEMTVIKPDGAILVSPESLETYWDEYCDVPKDDCLCIKEPFLIFPKGTNYLEICEWFNKMYPDGVLELIKKQMAKKFGEEYVNNWDIFVKPLDSVDAAHLICTSPDFDRTREFHECSCIDDTIYFTEEYKKWLLQEFADE